MLDLVQESQLAQQMGVAKAVCTLQLEVGAQAIMNQPADEARKKRKVLDASLTVLPKRSAHI